MSLPPPTSESEACSLVEQAAARRTPLALVGGGTKADIGRPAQSAGTLSSAGLSGVTLYESAVSEV
jgi:glycolate oxidase FAD binding subunit